MWPADAQAQTTPASVSTSGLRISECFLRRASSLGFGI